MSRLGIGFMRYDLDKDYSNLIAYALEHKINYFETAYFYLDYECEVFVNKLLKPYPRDSYEICGKFSCSDACRFAHFQELYYQQLRTVNGNYFDVYLIQTLRPLAIPFLQHDVINFFQKEKEKGNIRRFGFSEQCDDDMLSKILSINYKWDIAQMPLNFFDWYLNYSEKNYNIIKDNNIPIIAQAPLKGGELLNNVAEAISFVRSKDPEIILTGSSSIKHLMEIQRYIDNPIHLNYQKILDIIDIYRKEHFIKCIKCNRCVDACPKNIPIPLYYHFVNQYLQAGNKDPLTTAHYFMEEPGRICLGCGRCEEVCPFQHALPDFAKLIFNLQP